MTLSKAYDEIMERIQMSDDMRQRILQNIETQGIKENINKKDPPKKVILFRRISKYVSAAACLAVVIAGIALGPRVFYGTSQPSENGEEMAAVGNGIESCASAKELSQKLGFEISDIEELPFSVQTSEYFSYWGDLAEIDYEGIDAEGESQSLCYRKAPGTEDISGDYEVYEMEKNAEVENRTGTGKITVTLKGGQDGYLLAVWNMDGYSYAVSTTKGLTEEEMLLLVSQAK